MIAITFIFALLDGVWITIKKMQQFDGTAMREMRELFSGKMKRVIVFIIASILTPGWPTQMIGKMIAIIFNE